MTAAFLGRPLRVEEHVKDGESQAGEWVLFTDVVFRDSRGRTWVVPAGFITDLASIPRIARGIIEVNGKHRRAAVLHDYFYVMQQIRRAEADALFLEAMTVLKVPALQRHAMWASVRAGGWVYWDRRAGSDRSGDFVGPDYFTLA